MQIMFVTEFLPYPLDSGGKIRSFHILQALCAKHRVTLLTSAAANKGMPIPEILRTMCENVILVHCKRASWIKNFSLSRNQALSYAPLFIRRYYRSRLSEAVACDSENIKYDVVHYDHLDATIYRSFIKGRFHEVVDEHNIVTNQLSSSASAQSNILQSLALKTFVPSVRRYEAHICSAVCRCLVCSNDDSQTLSAMAPAAKVSIIPNGVDLDYYSHYSLSSQYPIHSKPKSLVFVGSLDYAPCDHGVRWFIREILPILRSQTPDLNFSVVGRNPSKRLQQLASKDPKIFLTGLVPDIRPFLIDADAAVVPLLSGSGTRLKILEAMAMGIPVVSTVIGAQGLAVEDGKQIFLADQPASFAAAVIKVLSSRTLRESICEAALELVNTLYGWKTIQGKLLDAYDALSTCKCKN
jgi:polysaccharide biosynthesis protein PslH